MILAPRYSSSEPPPASGPVRSKTTPILIFFPRAWAHRPIASIATAAKSPVTRRAVFCPSIPSSRIVHCVLFLLLAPITLGAASDVKRNGYAAARRWRRRGGVRGCDFRTAIALGRRRHCRSASLIVCQNSAPPHVRRPKKTPRREAGRPRLL